jgi:hypothetical protein
VLERPVLAIKITTPIAPLMEAAYRGTLFGDVVVPSLITVMDNGGCFALVQFHRGQHASSGMAFVVPVLSYLTASPGVSFIPLVRIIVLAGEVWKLLAVAVLDGPIRAVEIKAGFAALVGAGWVGTPLSGSADPCKVVVVDVCDSLALLP